MKWCPLFGRPLLARILPKSQVIFDFCTECTTRFLVNSGTYVPPPVALAQCHLPFPLALSPTIFPNSCFALY